jgi:hypothetical protein
MSDSDSKKISRQLAGKYGGVTDISDAINPPPPPAPAPARSRADSLWDWDDRPSDKPKYQRDKWASRPSKYEPSEPLGTPSWYFPEQEPKREPLPTVPLGRAMTARPPYEEGDVDWELADSIVMDRRVTWTHFVHMMGLEYPLYPQHDVQIYTRLNKIFLARKGKLFTE